MGSPAHKSAALSCIAYSYAAQIQPTLAFMPPSYSYDHSKELSVVVNDTLIPEFA